MARKAAPHTALKAAASITQTKASKQQNQFAKAAGKSKEKVPFHGARPRVKVHRARPVHEAKQVHEAKGKFAKQRQSTGRHTSQNLVFPKLRECKPKQTTVPDKDSLPQLLLKATHVRCSLRGGVGQPAPEQPPPYSLCP